MAAPENLLRQATSLYLLQHAGNPVHWRPWGAEALAEAAAADRPILLSVGYSACHWCHVMAHESFEDPATADLMNALFVSIKVDREERPDIDHLYMSALHALGEQGGWPLTMFLTPQAEPFWGGTYYPPTPRYGRPSFRQVLQGVADAWRQQHDAIRQNVGALKATLAGMSRAQPGEAITARNVADAAATLLRGTDPVQGGMRGAPKFPNPPIFRLLWQSSFASGLPDAAAAVHLLLRRMADGGIYDHLGGGFARYSTDAEWLAPHFEKMLYDNAQLLDLLALAHAAKPDPLYATRAAETVQWLDRDMTAPDQFPAAFAASEDADSEGEEGRFYVWQETEIDQVLGSDGAAFKRAYDVAPQGNWEGKTILRRMTPRGTDAEEKALQHSRNRLLAVRSRRVRPGRDDKILADWNGMAITALARSSAVFDRPGDLARATNAYRFVRTNMATPDGRIAHSWRLGRVTAGGLLDDQAHMARAALGLFEVTGEPGYLAQAINLSECALTWFADPDGSFFTTARDAVDVPLGPDSRPRTVADNAVPSGNGIMAEVMARLWHLTGDDIWRGRTEAVLTAFSGLGVQLRAAPTLLAAADLLERGVLVVVAGTPDRAAPMLRAALAAPDPVVCVLHGADHLPQGHPASGKTAPAGSALAYVCTEGTCELPVGSAEELTARLARRAGSAVGFA